MKKPLLKPVESPYIKCMMDRVYNEARWHPIAIYKTQSIGMTQTEPKQLSVADIASISKALPNSFSDVKYIHDNTMYAERTIESVSAWSRVVSLYWWGLFFHHVKSFYDDFYDGRVFLQITTAKR